MTRAHVALFLLAATFAACGPPAVAPTRTVISDKWLQRARASYKAGDFDDARISIEEAFRISPHDDDIRTTAAQLALSRLDFAEAIKLTEGLGGTDILGLRGRAHWYHGDLEQAADDLETMLQDPNVKDPWARDIARLARKGQGKKPFSIDGGIVAMVEMPPAGAALVVPCELEGDRVLAMIATGSGEVVLDSNARRDPSWVSFRFGDRIEVHDVPALTQDLSALSRQLGAPIRALLGVNFLRHVHATFDRRGSQFVVRLDEPTAPPEASRVPLFYVRGGGMLVRATVVKQDALLYVDSAQAFSLALNDATWTKAGVDLKSLQPAPQMPNVQWGTVPTFKLGGMEFPRVPAYSLSVAGETTPNVDVDLGGVLGASLLEAFRITFADSGKFLWVEPDPALLAPPPAPPPPTSVIPVPPPSASTKTPTKP